MLFAQLIALANSVVSLRCEIDNLQQEKSFLEAQNAERIAEWIRITARETIIERAETELGLITPVGPGPVIVMQDQSKERPASVWQKALDSFGGGGQQIQAVSAQGLWP